MALRNNGAMHLKYGSICRTACLPSVRRLVSVPRQTDASLPLTLVLRYASDGCEIRKSKVKRKFIYFFRRKKYGVPLSEESGNRFSGLLELHPSGTEAFVYR